MGVFGGLYVKRGSDCVGICVSGICVCIGICVSQSDLEHDAPKMRQERCLLQVCIYTSSVYTELIIIIHQVCIQSATGQDVFVHTHTHIARQHTHPSQQIHMIKLTLSLRAGPGA